MVICVVCDVLGEENNGTTIAAMNLIRSMRERGHEVRVICPVEDKKGMEGFYVVGTLNLGPLNGYVEKNGVVIAKGDKKVIQAAFDGADHVHIMMPFALGRAALKIAKKQGLSVSAGFHCQAENFTTHLHMKDSKFANDMTYKFFYNKFYRHVDAIHYPTQFIREVFEAYGEPVAKAYVISNGVSKRFTSRRVRRPAKLEGRKLILFTGRYSREKSHAVLIDAVAKSSHKDEIQLIFAGAGPLEHELKLKSVNLPHHPIFRFFDREHLVRVICASDLYVHPAEVEIEAISCLEAISCGLVPVIANSPRSATRFFAIDEMNLFNCNDSTDLAKKIDYWLDHPEEKAARCHDYLGYTRQFDFDECMDRMEQMIIETNARVREAKEQAEKANAEEADADTIEKNLEEAKLAEAAIQTPAPAATFGGMRGR